MNEPKDLNEIMKALSPQAQYSWISDEWIYYHDDYVQPAGPEGEEDGEQIR
jgi:hypothetical protein